MKKILITGATGYLGAKLSKYLAENDYSITALIRTDISSNCEWKKIMKEVIVGDIRDENVISSLAKRSFDVVIHLVSLDHHKSEDNPNYVSSINVLPTWNLLNSLTKTGLDKFIYFSTLQVLGKIPVTEINETFIPNPLNNYGLTHLLSEQIVNYFHNKTEINCINIRLTNGYGSPVFKENNCWWLVINDLCKSAYNQQKIKLLSDGSPQRDFIYISDICRAIDKLIKKNDGNFDENLFHIASGETLTILELAHIVKTVFVERYQKEIDICFPDNSVSKTPNRFNNVEKFFIDTTKLKNLGYEPKTDLKTGINKIFNYLEDVSA